MGEHLVKHGDGVKDIAFTVDDCRGLYKVCVYVCTHVCGTLLGDPTVAFILFFAYET